MDQSAFRQLLATTSGDGHAASSSSSSSSSQQRVFGATQKRSAAPSSSKSTITAADLAPRKVQRGSDSDPAKRKQRVLPEKNSATGEAYVDRAKARRVGKDDGEFADVLKLHEEWKAKWEAAQTDEERKAVEEQMAFLGGDARHSILVKGLDYSLLAQQRAKAEGRTTLAASAGASADDDLEAVFADVAAGNSKASSPPAATPDPADKDRQKRSREEVLEALKRRKMRHGGSPGAGSASPTPARIQEEESKQRDAEFERAKRLGKFKPIGPSGGGGSSSGSGFKAVGQSSASDSKDADVIITKDGKRLRKKKKKAPAPAPAPEAEPEPESDGRARDGEQRPPRAARSQTTEMAAPARKDDDPAASNGHAGAGPLHEAPRIDEQSEGGRAKAPLQVGVQPPTSASDNQGEGADGAHGVITAPAKADKEHDSGDDDDDDDDDIFAGAGTWKGLAGEDDDDDEDEDGDDGGGGGGGDAKAPGVARPAPADADAHRAAESSEKPPTKHDWFAGLGTARAKKSESQEPPSLPGVPGVPGAVPAQKVPPTPAAAEPEKAEEQAGGRLQGLSSSRLPSEMTRLILEREAEEARREREKSKGWWLKKRDRKRAKEGGGGGGEGEREGEE